MKCRRGRPGCCVFVRAAEQKYSKYETMQKNGVEQTWISKRNERQSSTMTESFWLGARSVLRNFPPKILVIGDSVALIYDQDELTPKIIGVFQHTVRVTTVLLCFPTSSQPSSSGGAVSSFSSGALSTPSFSCEGGLIECSKESSSSSRVSR